jgi:hypothetical protein
MDFSKLSSNDKLAAIGAGLAILGALFSFGGGGSFGLLTGVAMLVIVFLPQLSPSTQLPGSKGSLMMVVGGVGGLGALVALLALFSYGFFMGGYFIGLLLSIVGGLLMGWASWQEFQSEGGKFQLGSPAASGSAAQGAQAPAAPTAPPPAATPPPVTMAPPAAPPAPDPMSESPSRDEPGGTNNP